MKRISVIGCCGSGKSTLSLNLHQMTGLPIIHLDKEYWHSGWRPSESDDFRKRLEPIIAKDKWIIDGHYYSTMDSRLSRSDTVFHLDFSTTICFMRTIRRTILEYGKNRSDIAENCPERFDLEFLKYVLNFRRKFRARTIKLLSEHQHLKVYQFKHQKDLDLYLETAAI